MRRATAVLLLVAASAAAEEPKQSPAAQPGPPTLTAENYQQWRTAILPGEAERVWRKIPWIPVFWDGVVRAQRQHKPLLIWAMNGHPLGCT